MMQKLLTYFLDHPRVTHLILILIVLTGLGSAALLKRQSYPALSLNMVTVTTPYPGASAADVEVNVTGPLEDELREIENIQKNHQYVYGEPLHHHARNRYRRKGPGKSKKTIFGPL